MLRPVVRILLRNGMPYHAFVEPARKTHVSITFFEEFGVPGTRQTLSNVAVAKSLTRKQIKRPREAGFTENV